MERLAATGSCAARLDARGAATLSRHLGKLRWQQRRTPALARLRVDRFDERRESRSRDHRLHLAQEDGTPRLLTLGANLYVG